MDDEDAMRGLEATMQCLPCGNRWMVPAAQADRVEREPCPSCQGGGFDHRR